MRQIIALGGGGFSMEPDNPLMDTYILDQAKKPSPKICFIPTASGDSEDYIARFYDFFEKMDCEPSHLSLFRPPTRNIEDYIMEKDIIYVGGGNTKNLLAVWKEWGLDLILKKAYERGIILAGISAGSLCWFEEGVTDSYGDGLSSITCLGFLQGSNCPHYDGESERRPSYHRLILSEEIKGGIAADDGVALHFIEGGFKRAVSSRQDAKAFRVMKVKDKLVEEVIETHYLGQGNKP
ncbi:peptidase E [Bacillus sp. CECT 9360]|uniref:Type 1 glutamine amidotransferase-like domain-containing protein n=1 Tax=Bacillus sp. CECT 9360 TaxID=2845821 RepID=UPI001E35BD4B|nr:peptidase E [Bacillus sp. CECT 9360]CAH0344741.1 hypothetical protein BCI9360_01007 [Bacillus sp. CECT 9360]